MKKKRMKIQMMKLIIIKKKFEEVQTLLNVLKEGIKKILMKINIPKKDREEIKQLLKLCDFSNEETLMIFGDKKI